MSAGQDRSAKDKEMASRLKREGVSRGVMKCPMCHAVIGINSLFGHLSSHTGNSGEKKRKD